jgi:CHAT domain-containing protein
MAVRQAPDAASRVRASTQLALSLAQAGHLAEAEETLQSAYRQATDKTRYAIALALGNVAVRAHDTERARRYYQEVLVTAGSGPVAEDAKVTAELDLVGLHPANERAPLLEALLPRIDGMKNADYRAHAYFTVGQQAAEAVADLQLPGTFAGSQSGSEPPKVYDRVLRLSDLGFENAGQLARRSGDDPLEVDALDALAQLYESQGRFSDAFEINRRALRLAAALPLSRGEFPLVRLEWRSARLLQRRGDDAAALASYLRAARHLESIRQDLPIEDLRGKSTYQTLQRPLFVGLADLALKDFDEVPASQRQARLAKTVESVELTHQAELQDYLGDRCSVDFVRQGGNDSIAPGVAIVYPVVLKDRLEVIVRTNGLLLHHSAPVPAAVIADEIQNFRSAVLDVSSNDYLGPSRKLYGWLLAPFEQELTKAGVQELVVVPDGYLRLLPFAAMHDGKQFLAQRYAISTVTGLTMIEPPASRSTRPTTLFAGLATPGPVVDRLRAMGFAGSTELSANALSRGLGPKDESAAPANASGSRALTLRSELALPGVTAEISGLAPLAHSHTLLNGDFTVERFEHEVQSGNYRVVHIASHGFFGASADQSFLLAYDNVIKIDELRRLISANGPQSPGIDLLTLSACDTSTGDDRAPLGFAGAAIKAHARSVIGTLWAVNDTATQQFMESFYTALSRKGKASSLTQAQRTMIESPRFGHPYYWAPFVLTGDWN